MKKIKLKKYSLRKFFMPVFMALFLFLSFFPVSKARAWMAIPAAIVNANIMISYDTINGFMLSISKQAAVKALNQEVSSIITGSSSQGAMFVSDFRAYLIKKPGDQAILYANAKLDEALSGRGSLSQYIPAGSEGFGLSAQNYSNMLKINIQNSVISPSAPKVTYVGNPSQMFAQHTLRNLSVYYSGINNPPAMDLYIREQKAKAEQENQLIAAQKIQAGQGFPGTESNGKTITPGIVVKEAVTGVQDLGNKIIAGATHVPEVIMAAVSQIITQSITQGIGHIQASVNREVGSVNSQVTGQINAAVQQYGPGAQYTQNWSLGAAGTSK